jgi:hypothetical protein
MLRTGDNALFADRAAIEKYLFYQRRCQSGMSLIAAGRNLFFNINPLPISESEFP